MFSSIISKSPGTVFLAREGWQAEVLPARANQEAPVVLEKLPRLSRLLSTRKPTRLELTRLDNLTRPPGNMAKPQSMLHSLWSLLLFLVCADALKFDIEAFSQGDKKGERCIRNFVAKDTLVVVTATVDGHKGDGMKVDMHVSRFLSGLECGADQM